MKTKHLLALGAIAASSAAAQTPPRAGASAPSPPEIRERLIALDRAVADRSTPDRALRSYFLFLNNRGETNCLLSELHKLSANQGSFPLQAGNAIDRATRDRFFSGVAVDVLNRFTRLPSFAECMRDRESYSYEIVGVEPFGAARTRFTLVARNTTPVPAGAEQDDYSIRARRDGIRLRIDFADLGGDWRITQIDEWTSWSNEWRPRFTTAELQPLVPTLVPAIPY